MLTQKENKAILSFLSELKVENISEEILFVALDNFCIIPPCDNALKQFVKKPAFLL